MNYQITSLEEYYLAYQKSVAFPEQFWSEIALNFTWKKPWSSVLNWNFKEPNIKWFDGATLNITENCIDRHVLKNPNKIAIIWEPNNINEKHQEITYQELYNNVCAFAQVLINNGVQKGDRVCIYMGMIPALAIAALACARIGAIHSVIFGGFSAQSIVDRIEDAGATFVITCDGAYRGNKCIDLKSIVDQALEKVDLVKKVIVYMHTKTPVNMHNQRDVWWHEEIKSIDTKNKPPLFSATEMQAEDPLFILYTSGSTGKPKGVVHTTGGYMVYTNYSFVNVFQYKENQIYFCTADVGWITGHSYLIYGPLSAGATTLMFEGIPTYPDAGRLWDVVDKHQVNILYTAPTAIRSLMACGLEHILNKKLDSLQILGTVGEPINEEAWQWYYKHIGKEKCPIVDTWWQTETGGILISNLAGVTPHKPTHATLPLPGIQPILVDEQGQEITSFTDSLINGNLCIKFPWPSMLRTTYNNHDRCKETYFSIYKNLYFTGDGCFKDKEGNYRITGRVDDVLNVSGHRIGTAEVENAINAHAKVVESAIVAFNHDIKGQAIYAFVILENNANNISENDFNNLRIEIAAIVSKEIGAIAKPDKIQFVSGLPKTRSGKIMRRILRKIADNDLANIGDTSTLLDPIIVEDIKQYRII